MIFGEITSDITDEIKQKWKLRLRRHARAYLKAEFYDPRLEYHQVLYGETAVKKLFRSVEHLFDFRSSAIRV